jgi:site-specific recombinase XerD
MQNTSVQVYQFTLDSAVAEWIAQKKTRTNSAKTEKAYQDTMAAFRAFLHQGNLDLLDNPIDVARIATLWANMRVGQSQRAGAPVSPNTYNQRLAILSSFYSFLNENYMPSTPFSNPIETIKKRPVEAYAAAVPLNEDETVTGLERINRGTRQGMRDYALLAVALATGRRASELVSLRCGNIKITGKREKKVTLTFPHCKGGKSMRDALDEETSAVLLEYLHAEYGSQLLSLESDKPIWVSYSKQNYGQAISAKTLSNICMDVFDTGKVHTLRHTFADSMMESGSPITELAARLGHSDIKVTKRYTDKLRGEYNPFSERLTARYGIHRKGKK